MSDTDPRPDSGDNQPDELYGVSGSQIAHLRAAIDAHDLVGVEEFALGLHTADLADLIEELAPALAAGNPWRPLAVETEAALRLQAGETDKASTLYKSLADDASTPSQLRTRAAEMVRALGG